MKYNVDYFIKKFEAIPETKWITTYLNLEDAYCALGHCGVTDNDLNGHSFPCGEPSALCSLLKNHINYDSAKKRLGYDDYEELRPLQIVYFINDNLHPDYDQPTPKQRILAALYDIKKLQQPAYVDLTKSLAVLPEDKIEVDVNVNQPVYGNH
jgi:hypothetical protein